MQEYFLFHDRRKVFFPIHHGFTIGRAIGDLVFQDDPLISREHCRIHIVGTEVFIEDLDSANSTIVNRVPIIPNRKRRVLLNDVIKVGDQRLILTRQRAHHPAGVQDQTMFHKVVIDDFGDATRSLIRSPSAEETGRTMVLRNHELSPGLLSQPSRRRRILVQAAGVSQRRSRRLGLKAAGWCLLVAGVLVGAIRLYEMI